MNVFRPKCCGGKHGHQRGINPAAQAQQRLGVAGLAAVIADAERQGVEEFGVGVGPLIDGGVHG